MILGLAAVSYLKFGTTTAWPWFALVGSTTVVVTGLMASRLGADPVSSIEIHSNEME
jgi:hypothetical protein